MCVIGQVSMPGCSNLSVVFDGIRYEMEQFHFHSPSEHLIGDARLDGEAHFVHVDRATGEIGCFFPHQLTYGFWMWDMCMCTDAVVLIPISGTGNLLVLGIFMAGTATIAENEFLAPIWSQGFSHEASTVAYQEVLNPYHSFFPPDLSYITYTGSTTTPPCKRGVKFVLLTQPVRTTQAQIQAMRSALNTTTASKVSGSGNDNRPQQELGKRKIYYYVEEPAYIRGYSKTQRFYVGVAIAGLVMGAIGVITVLVVFLWMRKAYHMFQDRLHGMVVVGGEGVNKGGAPIRKGSMSMIPLFRDMSVLSPTHLNEALPNTHHHGYELCDSKQLQQA